MPYPSNQIQILVIHIFHMIKTLLATFMNKHKGIAGVAMWTTNPYFDSLISQHFNGV